MNVSKLHRYDWPSNLTAHQTSGTLVAALNTAFIYLSIPDIGLLGPESYTCFLIQSSDALPDIAAIKESYRHMHTASGKSTSLDTHVWTDLHVSMSKADTPRALLRHLCDMLKGRDIAPDTFSYVLVVAYITASVLLYDSLILGKTYYLANEYARGMVFSILVNSLETVLPICKEKLYILEPIFTLLTRLLPYIPYCTNTEYSARIISLLRPKLRSGQHFLPEDPAVSSSFFAQHDITDQNKQFRSNTLINLCINVLICARQDSLIVSMPPKTVPAQNVKVRMFLVACQFLLSTFGTFKDLQQLALIDYIESILGFRILGNYNSTKRGAILLSLLFNLIKEIRDMGELSLDLKLFICEMIFALLVCTYYHQLPCIQKAFYVGLSEKDAALRYYRSLMSKKNDDSASFSFTTLNECANMMLHGVVLGNVIRRYNAGTLLLYNSLLVPNSNLAYLWVREYHSLTEIYSSIIVDLRTDAASYCNEKSRIQTIYFSDTGELTLTVHASALQGKIKYTDNRSLEKYPFIYEVLLPDRTLHAVYIAQSCKFFEDSDVEMMVEREASSENRVFRMRLAKGEYDTYILSKAYRLYQCDQSSRAFYIHWTHPSVSCHLDVVQHMNQQSLDIYYNRVDYVSDVFNALVLQKESALSVPYRSYTCYGYAAVADQSGAYIRKTLENLYNDLSSTYHSKVCIQFQTEQENTQPQIVVTAKSRATSNNKADTNIIVFGVPFMQTDGRIISNKQFFTTKTLRPSQFKALMYAILSPVTFILGCPGSGKSTTLAHIAKALLLAESADSKWISTSTNSSEWSVFKDVYRKSIRCYDSCLTMLTDLSIGTQLLLMAHSNNAADQLTKYILMADNWALYTIPFVVRIGESSVDPFVRNFMPLQYLLNLALELKINIYDQEKLQEEICRSPRQAFNKLSQLILKALAGTDASQSASPNVTPQQSATLQFILSDYMAYMEWLVNRATIVVSTITGISSRIRFLQKHTDRFSGESQAVRDRGYQLMLDIVGRSQKNGPGASARRFKRRQSSNNQDTQNGADTKTEVQLAMRMMHYRAPERSERHLIIEEAARLAEHALALILHSLFEKLILIGDVLQLPPLIQDPKLAAVAAMDWSIFHRICYSSQRGIPIVTLEEQARSVPEIADLYRSLYESNLPVLCKINGGLKDIPNVQFNSFMDKVILSEFGGRCFFCPPEKLGAVGQQIDTINKLYNIIQQQAMPINASAPQQPSNTGLKKTQPRKSGGCISEKEKNMLIILLMRIIVRALAEGSKSENHHRMAYNHAEKVHQITISVALLSLYNAQKSLLLADESLAALKELCVNYRFVPLNSLPIQIILELSIETSDGYQGLEADIVFLSLTASNGNDFRNNICRSLVATSRARRLFVCVGAAKALTNIIWENVANKDTCSDVQLSLT